MNDTVGGTPFADADGGMMNDRVGGSPPAGGDGGMTNDTVGGAPSTASDAGSRCWNGGGHSSCGGTTKERDGGAENGSSGGSSSDDGGGSGWMTGGGFIITPDGLRVSHGFELHCAASDPRQNLEVNWGKGHHFHLTGVSSVACNDLPGINSGKPAAGFNTIAGVGVGLYDEQGGAVVEFTFSDAGEPGRSDTVGIIVYDADGNVVLNASGPLRGGNDQAHD
jgi:hypothetical protein